MAKHSDYEITRDCAGSYTVNAYGFSVTVCKVSDWAGAAKWHWRDEYHSYCYGDPVMTKAEAVEGAVSYAKDRKENPEDWR